MLRKDVLIFFLHLPSSVFKTISKLIIAFYTVIDMKSQGISQVIRYQEELKVKMQQTENLILEGKLDRSQLATLKSLIGEEDVLLKYLEVESSRLQPDVRNIYARNMTRFKKKIKEHKEYINSQYGQGTVQNYHDPYKIAQTMQIQQQNNQLLSQKLSMYDNERMQNNIGFDLDRQGNTLQANVERNRQIREEADAASDNIKLIQRAIFKRKFMFYSLFVLLGLALGFVIIRRITKAAK